jgi:hypothetical protein
MYPSLHLNNLQLHSSTGTALISLENTSKMKHLAAYLLLGLAGNTSPSAADITSVLESVGIDADEERLEKLLSELEGKDISEVSQICCTQQKRKAETNVIV